MGNVGVFVLAGNLVDKGFMLQLPNLLLWAEISKSISISKPL